MNPQIHKSLFEVPNPFVNKSKPELLDELSEVHQFIRQYLYPSPLKYSPWLSQLLQAEVWLKLECLNPTGAFKIRGALNAIRRVKELSDKETKIKIVAASAGNHAQGVAYAAKLLDCEAHIFVPHYAPMVKRNRTQEYGATLYIQGNSIEETFQAAEEFAQQENAILLHPFNNYDIILGQGTCAKESFEQYEQLTGKKFGNEDIFLASIGGGGLMAGAVVASMPYGNQLIGVEHFYYDATYQSLLAGNQVMTTKEKVPTIAEGIASSSIGNLNFHLFKSHLARVDLVNDEQIASAVVQLCEKEHILAEGAGAAVVADMMANPENFQGKNVIACISGGNIDLTLFTRILSKEMTDSQRNLSLSIALPDKAGNLEKLLHIISLTNANVLEIHHDRTYKNMPIGEVSVDLLLETQNPEHVEKIKQTLNLHQYKFKKFFS